MRFDWIRLWADSYPQRIIFRSNGMVGFVELKDDLHGYGDASGKYETVKDRIFTVNGCLGTYLQWQDFDVEWQEYLKEARFIPDRTQRRVFHTSNFWVGKCPLMPPRLRGMPTIAMNREKQTIYRDLVKIIAKYTDRIFGYAVLLNDFRRIEKDFPFSNEIVFGQPGTLLSNLSIRNNSNWAADNNFPRAIGYIFDRGDNFLEELAKQFNEAAFEAGEDNVSSFGWKNKAEFSPLQAADIVAWECRRYWHDRFFDPVRSLIPQLPSSHELTVMVKDPDGIRMYDYDHVKNEMLDVLDAPVSQALEIDAIGEDKPFASIEDCIRWALVDLKQDRDIKKAIRAAADQAEREKKKREKKRK